MFTQGSSEYLVVGAPEVGDNVDEVGEVYVFERNPDGTFGNRITLSNQAQYQAEQFSEFGKSVALTETSDGILWIFAGAPFNDAAPFCDVDGEIEVLQGGSVEVFQLSETTWSWSTTLFAPDCFDESEFGHSLGASQDRVIIGAPYARTYDQQIHFSGAAYEGIYDGNSWSVCAKLRSTEPRVGGELGISVSIVGDIVVVGSPKTGLIDPNDSNSGYGGQVLAYTLHPMQDDCNGNGISDAIDLCSGTETDCNNNGILDSCEIAANELLDCNWDGVTLPRVLDECEIATGAEFDCDGDGVLDSCQIDADPSLDCNWDGVTLPRILDACEVGRTLFITFIIDGSFTINPTQFQRQKDAIKDILCGTLDPLSSIDSLIVSVIQFSSNTLVEIPPIFFVSDITICDRIDAIVQLGTDNILASGLSLAKTQFDDVGSTITRELIVMTDTLYIDWISADLVANELKSMDPPVRICAAMVSEDVGCTNTNMNDLVNAGHLDPNQPEGFVACLTQADKLVSLCSTCLVDEVTPNGWKILVNDCNGNDLLDECEDCPGDVTGDGIVDVSDLLEVVAHWLEECPPSCTWDIDLSGVVDVGDILAVIDDWGCGDVDCLGIPQTVQDCLARYPLGSQGLEKCLELVEFLQSQGN